MSAEGSIGAAVAALGPGALTEIGIRSHVAPLFSRAIAASPARIYLANHSLGRPLDRMEDDVREGLAPWYAHLDDAWDAWMDELARYRTRIAKLLHAASADAATGLFATNRH